MWNCICSSAGPGTGRGALKSAKRELSNGVRIVQRGAVVVAGEGWVSLNKKLICTLDDVGRAILHRFASFFAHLKALN